MINEVNYEEYLGRIANILEFIDKRLAYFCDFINPYFILDLLAFNRLREHLRDMSTQIDKDLGYIKNVPCLKTKEAKEATDNIDKLLQKWRGFI